MLLFLRVSRLPQAIRDTLFWNPLWDGRSWLRQWETRFCVSADERSFASRLGGLVRLIASWQHSPAAGALVDSAAKHTPQQPPLFESSRCILHRTFWYAATASNIGLRSASGAVAGVAIEREPDKQLGFAQSGQRAIDELVEHAEAVGGCFAGGFGFWFAGRLAARLRLRGGWGARTLKRARQGWGEVW